MASYWDGVPVISAYTRAQAIEDGVLADVSEMAKEAGFTVPVAVTSAVWALVEPTEQERDEWMQSVNGRLWDVLWMAHVGIKMTRSNGTEMVYPVSFQMHGRDGERNGSREMKLKLVSGPGDQGEHVITIMLPDED